MERAGVNAECALDAWAHEFSYPVLAFFLVWEFALPSITVLSVGTVTGTSPQSLSHIAYDT